MTLREKICDAGVSTLREYMCVSIGEGDGDVIINSELVEVQVTGSVLVEVEDDTVQISREEKVLIEVESDIIEVVETKREVVDVVC